MTHLYASVTDTSNVLGVVVSGSHDSPVTTATIEAVTTSLDLGDSISVDIGDTVTHSQVFTGYVKQVSKKTPENTYTIVAYDNLVRAQDFYIASSDPNQPFKRKGILAEDLVRDLLALAGLTNYSHTDTYFTFGINNEFEINLVTVYDYIRTICDLITWSLWADQDGTVHFENRKPYVMTGDTGQPGDDTDETAIIPVFRISSSSVLDATHTSSEKSLRNRIVVYGSNNIHAEASEASSVLPADFYKTAVLAMPQIIDSQSLADSIASYNLNLLNRVTESVNATIVGNPGLSPRMIVGTSVSELSLTGNWYLFGVDHQWGKEGYTTNIELRRMTKV